MARHPWILTLPPPSDSKLPFNGFLKFKASAKQKSQFSWHDMVARTKGGEMCKSLCHIVGACSDPSLSFLQIRWPGGSVGGDNEWHPVITSPLGAPETSLSVSQVCALCASAQRRSLNSLMVFGAIGSFVEFKFKIF